MAISAAATPLPPSKKPKAFPWSPEPDRIRTAFTQAGQNANSELILLMYTPATYDVADVIGTYTYRMGIEGGQYSYTTAAGLFMSLIGFALTFAANKVSNRLTGYGLW